MKPASLQSKKQGSIPVPELAVLELLTNGQAPVRHSPEGFEETAFLRDPFGPGWWTVSSQKELCGVLIVLTVLSEMVLGLPWLLPCPQMPFKRHLQTFHPSFFSSNLCLHLPLPLCIWDLLNSFLSCVFGLVLLCGHENLCPSLPFQNFHGSHLPLGRTQAHELVLWVFVLTR